MTLNGISAPAALPAVNSHPHGHRRGAPDAGTTAGSSSVGSVGQLPVGATSGLFSRLLQSLRQAVGARAAASPQNLQNNTLQSPNAVGGNVNTHV